jgi:hypothetical protein
MNAELLIYIGSVLPLFWGITHLFPTRNVVQGFGDISDDNKNIIRMEWITEGVALIFIGITVANVTVIEPGNVISITVYIISTSCLIVLSVVSLFTGFKIHFMPFKLCPIVFSSSAILITIGWILI